MIWNKKKDGAENPGAETPAAQTTKAPVLFLQKNWKWLVPVVCVVIAGGVFLLKPKSASTTAVDPSYLEASPEVRDVSNTLSGTGTLNPANTYTVKSLVEGKVLTGEFEEGDVLDEGSILYTLDSSDASTNFEKAEIAMQQAQRGYDKVVDRQYVRAEVDGTVSTLKVAKGDEVTSGQEVAIIRDSSKMMLTLEFPAADAANFSVGQTAQVTLDGTFEAVSGTVRSVSGADALSSGNLLVRTVTIAVNNTGSLTTAQAATASVNGVSALASAKFSYQNEQTITASTGGTVTALCVKEGSSVSADTALVRISGKELTKQVQNASDNLRSAQMSMEDTEDQLNNYTITSPISGTVISKEVKAGDTVSNTAGSTSLCTIYDLSYLQMTMNVDELEILSIKEGQSVTITADAISGRTFTGVVTSVSKAGTTAGGTTTYPVTIRINDTGDLLPGMNATAEITTASTENALSIPNAAVVRGNYVLVTKDSPSAANADPSMTAPEGYVYVKVTTGTSDDDYIAVTSGLQEGDTVAYTASSTASVSADGQMEEMMVVGGPGQGGGPSGGAPGGGPQ